MLNFPCVLEVGGCLAKRWHVNVENVLNTVEYEQKSAFFLKIACIFPLLYIYSKKFSICTPSFPPPFYNSWTRPLRVYSTDVILST